jgi:hypothetical protein
MVREKCDFLAAANMEGRRCKDPPVLACGRNHNNINQGNREASPLFIIWAG